eukprot:1590653-Ditylum_brightwellii.AAC.1
MSVPDVLHDKNNNQPLTPVTSCQQDTAVWHTITHHGDYVYYGAAELKQLFYTNQPALGRVF